MPEVLDRPQSLQWNRDRHAIEAAMPEIVEPFGYDGVVHTCNYLVARVHRPDDHTHAKVASELPWIEALRGSRVVVTPAPVRSITGGFI